MTELSDILEVRTDIKVEQNNRTNSVTVCLRYDTAKYSQWQVLEAFYKDVVSGVVYTGWDKPIIRCSVPAIRKGSAEYASTDMKDYKSFEEFVREYETFSEHKPEEYAGEGMPALLKVGHRWEASDDFDVLTHFGAKGNVKLDIGRGATLEHISPFISGCELQDGYLVIPDGLKVKLTPDKKEPDVPKTNAEAPAPRRKRKRL